MRNATLGSSVAATGLVIFKIGQAFTGPTADGLMAFVAVASVLGACAIWASRPIERALARVAVRPSSRP